MIVPLRIWNIDSNESALKQLTRLADEKRKSKRPNVPVHAWGSMPPFRDHTANELTKSIIEFMDVVGGQAERINSMGRQINYGGQTKWIYGTGTNGTADISATWEGISIKIEVKATKGEKQIEVQKQYQKSIEQAGGIYLLARNMEGFVFQLFKAVEGLNNGH
jgi:hypothetical protein